MNWFLGWRKTIPLGALCRSYLLPIFRESIAFYYWVGDKSNQTNTEFNWLCHFRTILLVFMLQRKVHCQRKHKTFIQILIFFSLVLLLFVTEIFIWMMSEMWPCFPIRNFSWSVPLRRSSRWMQMPKKPNTNFRKSVN